MSLKLHDCVISRRGKAAKGTVAVKTFGIPVLDEDGVAKDWLYTEVVKGKSLQTIIDEVKAVDEQNEQILAISFLMGRDIDRKSETARDNNEASLLANRIFASGLAQDNDVAKRLAAQWLPILRNAVDVGYADTMDDAIAVQMNKRKRIVDDLKSKGQWTLTPRLVRE